MKWYRYIGYLFSGAFLANSIPHLVSGISGREFSTPLANPSSAILNGIWGLINLIAGMAILIAVGGLAWKFDRRWIIVALGFIYITIQLSFVFSQK